MTFTVPDWDGPGTGFTIIDAVAYIDTVEILVEFPLPGGLLGKLRKLARKRMTVRDATRPEKADPTTRHAYGKIIALTQPSVEGLRLIVALCGDRYRVRRVDVACDFHLATARQARNCGRYLQRHGWQKWRGNIKKCHQSENVTYWSTMANVPRNIALYFDKPSRKNGEPCAHWEMRFITADACRRAGLHNLNILLEGIDALKLLKRQAKLKALDRRRFFKRTEEIARRTKRRYPSALKSRTVAQVQNRVHGMLFATLQRKNFTLDEATIHTVMAQEVHDRAPLLRKTLVEVGNWEELTPAPRWLR